MGGAKTTKVPGGGGGGGAGDGGTRARLVEAAVLLVTTAWLTWGFTRQRGLRGGGSDDAVADAADAWSLLPHAVPPRMLGVANVLALAAGGWSLLAPRPVPQSMQRLSRHERDEGLAVGCVLVPLVLLSRVLVQEQQTHDVSALALLYAWIAISAGLSLLLKITLLQSSGILPTLVVDVLLLPIAFSALGIESDLRFVLPSIGRFLIGAIFRLGRLALPRSFTTGEAMLVAQGLGLATLDLLLVTAVKIDAFARLGLPDGALANWHLVEGLERPAHVLAAELGVLGSLGICVALIPVLGAFGTPSPHLVAPVLPPRGCVQFVGTLGAVALGLLYPWSVVLLETWDPLTWLLGFVLEAPSRPGLVGFWLLCLVLLVPLFGRLTERLGLRQILARKLFHALVVVMFVPAYFASPEMLGLSYGVALAVFALVECARAVSLPPIGHRLAAFVGPFIDHREGGRAILTHTYLLLGCALPLWLAHSTAPGNALAANAGVLALGIGDAMGAAIGSTFGRRRLFGTKTWEGTGAVCVSMLGSSLLLEAGAVGTWTALSATQVLALGAGIALTSLLEAATAQIDNLVLSLYFFTIVNVVHGH